MWGVAISQQSEQWNTPTGQLERNTLLHKRYVVIRTIGQGGMGAVYQARDIKRNTLCAIKEMSLSIVPPDEQPQAIHNFKAEAKMLWGLNHPNLPAFHGFFSEGPRYFMVMEYVDGATLESLLERNNGPFQERRVLGWARQLCDVLEYLHSQNPPIIFRDMKPGNIMLTARTGRIKLIDFGIARFFRPLSAQDTQLLGTPGFAPPEQYGKAQTDARADIYSLAMTLFQLLTNTLSETGFGLKDVRSINPQISPMVARALEKATSLEPENRYPTVAAFRRALLGVGTFLFENGDQATTPRELADLCARYPEEASDYLADGEIESWLKEIGEEQLARSARQIRAAVDDPQEAVEQFIRNVMGPNARIRGYSGKSPTPNTRSGQVAPSTNGASDTTSATGRSWLFQRVPRSNVIVQPRNLDFGQLYPGMSAPMSFTISGNQGMRVKGLIRAIESWIVVDQTHFDGMETRVNVRINSSQLNGLSHYTGTILISPDITVTNGESKNVPQDIIVEVDADILTLNASNGSRYGGKTTGADLDDDDDAMLGTMVGLTGKQVAVQANPMSHAGQTMHAVPSAQASTNQVQKAQSTLITPEERRDNEYKAKYGNPTVQAASGASYSGWEQLQVTPKQRTWMRRGLAFVSASMLASLCYTLIGSLVHTNPLPPSPWFILVLVLMIPAATLGALLVHWESSWSWQDLWNRACTGMGGALLIVSIIEILWQSSVHTGQHGLQLAVMLFIAALGATVGTLPQISDYMLKSATWAMTHLRTFMLIMAVIVGGALGYFLTAGLAFGALTPIGILLGIVVCILLVLRVDKIVRQRKAKPSPPVGP